MSDTISKSQLKVWGVLGAITIIGAVLSTGTLDTYLAASLTKIAHELGAALFTAGILGLTVDVFLKREIARDVFSAAFMYVLPDELRDEVKRIINYRFLCIESFASIKIEEVNKDIVKMSISLERTLKNITRHAEETNGAFALDEWGFAGRKSCVLECRLDIDPLDTPPLDDPNCKGKKEAVGALTRKVSVKSDETLKTVAKGVEFGRRNGEFFLSFQTPTVRPEVSVEVPKGISYSCSFGVPGEKIKRSSITDTYRLDGTQFPGQHTRIRWWPTGKASKA